MNWATRASLVFSIASGGPSKMICGSSRSSRESGNKLSPEEAAQLPGVKPASQAANGPDTTGKTPWMPQPAQNNNAGPSGGQAAPTPKPHVLIRTKEGKEVTLGVGDTYDFSAP